MKPPADAPTRHKVLFFLKTKGPQTAAQLAKRLSVTTMAVRQHLAALQQEQLVGFEDERARVGRPRRVWHVTEAAAARFPDSHSELALSLLEAVRAAFGDAGVERLIEERARQQRDAYAESVAPDAPLEKRVAALAAVRDREGYMAEVSKKRDGTLELIENHCPICTAAQACQGLCAGELELFRTMLGDGVEVERTEHIVSGDRRCVYRIRDAGEGRLSV